MTLQPQLRIRLDVAPVGAFEQLTYPVGLKLTTIKQIGDQLCWAACIEAELTRIGRPKSQKAIVSEALPDCPLEADDDYDLIDPKCDRPIVPPEGLQDVWRAEGFAAATYSEGDIPFEALRDHLRDKGPVQVIFANQHAVMVDTWIQGSQGTVSVRYMDPWVPVHREVCEEALRSGIEAGVRWTGTVTPYGLPEPRPQGG